jgi:hypothetical protein
MDSGKGKSKRKTVKGLGSDQIIDASPGNNPPDMSSQAKPLQPLINGKARSVQDTVAWQTGSRSIGRIWANYVENLKLSFSRMPRAGQIELITKGSIVLTMGVAVISLGLFYYFLPTIVRIFALPGALIIAWFTATKLVAVIIKDRLEKFLNSD